MNENEFNHYIIVDVVNYFDQIFEFVLAKSYLPLDNIRIGVRELNDGSSHFNEGKRYKSIKHHNVVMM